MCSPGTRQGRSQVWMIFRRHKTCPTGEVRILDHMGRILSLMITWSGVLASPLNRPGNAGPCFFGVSLVKLLHNSTSLRYALYDSFFKLDRCNRVREVTLYT